MGSSDISGSQANSQESWPGRKMTDVWSFRWFRSLPRRRATATCPCNQAGLNHVHKSCGHGDWEHLDLLQDRPEGARGPQEERQLPQSTDELIDSPGQPVQHSLCPWHVQKPLHNVEYFQTTEAPHVPFGSPATLQSVATMLTSNSTAPQASALKAQGGKKENLKAAQEECIIEPWPTAPPVKASTPEVVRPGLQPASPSSSLTLPTKPPRCSKAAPSTLQPRPLPHSLLKTGPHLGLQAALSHHFGLPRDIGVWCCLYMLTPLLFPAHCQ
uniref:uncharacterized protein LOC129516939 isoform X1 n=1 Tax=Nyctereutes procyonoides TaxID=34880 RepID=UPI0024444639|nr:uncharacterized protein LOC129516939 isoform X1 [Nyctereutes procyonoides]